MTLGEELAQLEIERGELESEIVKAQRNRDRETEHSMFAAVAPVVDRLRVIRAELQAAAIKERVNE